MYDTYSLTPKTHKKLMQFHKKSGLIYAAYDFIVDSSGNEIFLECNPGGQWLWIEHALQQPISKAIATALLD